MAPAKSAGPSIAEDRSELSFLEGKALPQTRLPRHLIYLLEALDFADRDCEGLKRLTRSEWEELLALCDDTQLTLLLCRYCRPALPDWVRIRVDRNWTDNAFRFERLKSALFDISQALSERSIDFALLKGLTHSPDFSPDPLLRAQGDIDIWCLPEKISDAREALIALGYRPIAASKNRHLAPMVRDFDWEWRGDYFARDLPLPVDLHYQLWDEEMEAIAGPREKDIWARRHPLSTGDLFLVLDTADTLTFAALHLLMHLLHGDARLQRAWEIAYFLQTRSADDDFWERWHAIYPPGVRELQVVVFCLTSLWFNCSLPDLVVREAESLSEDIKLWIQKYGWSPIEALFVPNKDELWLNLSLVRSWQGKLRVFCRRLLPINSANFIKSSEAHTALDGPKQPSIGSSFLVSRAAHHMRTLLPTCRSGFWWWFRRKGLPRDFLIFLFASALFDFGEFIFFLLYNLYLLDFGYREKFMGQLAAVLTAGTLAGVIPAAAFTNRVGLRKALLVAITGTACATTLRAIVIWPPALLCGAFLNGFFMSIWAVTLAPMVAGFTTERNRTLGFALITSIGIGAGAVAGFAGGHLPALLVQAGYFSNAHLAKRAALLLGSGLAALAIFPALKIKYPLRPAVPRAKTLYPRSRFLYVFLACMFVWTVGTGGFNPFFNVYFSQRLHLGTEQIGAIFSYGQLMQVGVILAAPLVVRRIGEQKSIAGMQLATAAMLSLLAIAPGARLSAALYIGYMCFQYMSEPCLFSMLMNGVDEPYRSGASALNFFVTSLAGIFAAAVAGSLLANRGYGFTLTVCAAVTTIAALTFFLLFRRH